MNLQDTPEWAAAVTAIQKTVAGCSGTAEGAVCLKCAKNAASNAAPSLLQGVARLDKANTFPVVSVEWGSATNPDVAEGDTRITVKGIVQPVGAGDTIAYRRAADCIARIAEGK